MKIILADDHALFRDGLKQVLLQAADDTVVFEAGNANEVRSLASEQSSLDLVMLDLGMPDMQGIITVGELCEQLKPTPVLMVSADDNPATMNACMQAGAAGYIPKTSPADTIISAIKMILSGGTYFPKVAFERHTSISINNFSARQQQLLGLLAEGLSNKQIADQLHLSEGTVKQYVSTILDELGVDNRTQAGIKARELLGIGTS